MKKSKGFSTVAAVVSVIVVAVLCLLTVVIINHNNAAVDFESYPNNTVVEASEDNGGIADHVRGSADAPVVIHEYANFQCPHCAVMDPIVKQAVEDADGKLAIVFRNMTWSAFQNSKAAASAAEAAGLQGYWEAYADKLFEEQAEWSYADGSERTDLFNKYFDEVTGGNGDREKFQADISSDAVAKKIAFDAGMADQVGADGTPAFFIDGQVISLDGGGDIEINGKTIHYEKLETGEDFVKLTQEIIAAKTSV